MYLLVYAVRFAVFVILSPLLSITGYGLSWLLAIIGVCTGIHGIIPMCLTFWAHDPTSLTRTDDNMIWVIAMAGVEMLESIINGTTTSTLVKAIGYNRIPFSRLSNMRISLRVIMNKRDRSISVLRRDR